MFKRIVQSLLSYMQFSKEELAMHSIDVLMKYIEHAILRSSIIFGDSEATEVDFIIFSVIMKKHKHVPLLRFNLRHRNSIGKDF